MIVGHIFYVVTQLF